MADSTQDELIENTRFQANTEQQERNVSDEEKLQDIAEFIQLTADSVANPNLSAQLKTMSNEIVTNKSVLANTPGENGSVPVSPEEALAQQGGLQGGNPPGGIDPATGQPIGGEIPPEVQQALAQQQGGGQPQF